LYQWIDGQFAVETITFVKRAVSEDDDKTDRCGEDDGKYDFWNLRLALRWYCDYCFSDCRVGVDVEKEKSAAGILEIFSIEQIQHSLDS